MSYCDDENVAKEMLLWIHRISSLGTIHSSKLKRVLPKIQHKLVNTLLLTLFDSLLTYKYSLSLSLFQCSMEPYPCIRNKRQPKYTIEYKCKYGATKSIKCSWKIFHLHFPTSVHSFCSVQWCNKQAISKCRIVILCYKWCSVLHVFHFWKHICNAPYAPSGRTSAMLHVFNMEVHLQCSICSTSKSTFAILHMFHLESHLQCSKCSI